MPKKARKDEDDRIFICGCGRSYLSYPALYIHVRNKHNGIRQQNTILPNKGEIQKQQMRQKMAKNNTDNDQETYQYQNTSQRYNQELVLKQISDYLEQRGNHSLPQRNLIIADDEDKINYYQLFLDYQKDFLDYLNDQNYLQDFNKLKQQLQNLNQQEEEDNIVILDEDENGNFKASVDFILSQFLQNISKELNEEGYFEICIFILMMRKGLNQEALKYLNQEDFCQNNTGDDILDLFNNLCINFFPQELRKINELPNNQRQLVIFDLYGDIQTDQVYEKNNIVRLLHGFSKWLFCSKYTQYSLSIDQDYYHN